MELFEEDQILRSAISKGLLSIEESERLVSSRLETSRSSRWGAKIDSLISSGSLQEMIVESICEELEEKKSGKFPVENWERYEFVEFIGQGIHEEIN